MVVSPAQLLAEDRYVRVGNHNTRYRLLGNQGKPLVLIHGIGCSLEDWDCNVAALAQKHSVYALDMLGCGLSDKPQASYTIQYLTEFLREFLRTQGIERASLVGNSLGGAVALDFAIRHPEQVDRLVLVDPAGLGREVSILFRLGSVPGLGRQLTKPSPKNMEQVMRTVVFDQSLLTPALIQFRYELAALPGAQDAFLATVCQNVDLFGVKSTVVKSIAGRLDAITPPHPRGLGA